MIKFSKQILSDLTDLFFPRNCAACGAMLVDSEQYLCIGCLKSTLGKQRTSSLGQKIKERLLGRLPISDSFSLLRFEKGGNSQRILNQIKYYKNLELAFYLGKIVGNAILQDSRNFRPDILVPVPLHPRKEKLRGFNQSLILANGMADSLKCPSRNCLKRIRHTNTQTKKNKIQRWLNVEGAFGVWDEKLVIDKNVMLIDDVFTTGATIEACGIALINCGVRSLSVATLAIADH